MAERENTQRLVTRVTRRGFIIGSLSVVGGFGLGVLGLDIANQLAELDKEIGKCPPLPKLSKGQDVDQAHRNLRYL